MTNVKSQMEDGKSQMNQKAKAQEEIPLAPSLFGLPV
jgi:hypothetical protein